MVKKRGQAKSQSGGDGQSASSPSESVIVGGPSSKNKARFNRKWLLPVVLVVVVAGLAFWAITQYNAHKNTSVVVIKSEQQVIQQELKDALANPPPKNAPDAEQTAYYDKLIRIQEYANDYAGATKSFETRQQVSTEGLNYLNYFNAAKDYCKISDKAGVKSTLTQARNLLPPNDNRDTGYFKAIAETQIDTLGQECGV